MKHSRFNPKMKSGILLLAICVALMQIPSPAVARDRDMVREAAYEKQLAAIDASLVPLYHAATKALDKDDYAEAEKLYQLVYAKAPDFDVAVRRLGSCLLQQNRRAEGLGLCERATQLNRSAENLSTLAYGLFAVPAAERAPGDNERALALLKEARRLPGGDDTDYAAMYAQVCLRLNDIEGLREALADLEKQQPDQMATHYFAACVAAYDEHWMRAEDEILKAEKLGLPHDAAQQFLDSGIHSRAMGWRYASYTVWAVGCWAIGLGLLYVLGVLLSKLTLRQAETADLRMTVNPGEHRLRQIYRTVLNFAGVYYYISLPIIVVLVLGIVAALFYGCLMAGRIPIKLMLILGIGAIATVYSLVRSLFIRVKTEDPGRALTREEAENLWRLTEEVAQTVNTRPIDEIRITPGTDLAVYERGSWRDKLQNKAKRILILGTGVLNGFKIDDFRCVLAHEYGHFSNRDTAGGDIALRVRSDIMKFYFAMRDAGQATYYNVAFHFLRLYHFIFRRISHGATRLQEILADRVAAQSYGALALEGGLRHVIRRSLEFDRYADLEIKAGIEAKRPLQNLYEGKIEGDGSLEKEFEKAISRETTEDDTHPSPKDRFRLVAALMPPACSPRHGEVWSLFRDRDALMREMMALIEKNVASHRERGDPTLAVKA